MFKRNLYSSPIILNAFEMMGVMDAAPSAEGTSGAASTDTGWSFVSG
ncbi:hypothetical protein ACIPLC_01695 [Kitasatospora sp. NPDC086801]